MLPIPAVNTTIAPAIRRVVYRHTAGPYPGLRQIMGLADARTVVFLHSGEARTLEAGMPDRMAAVAMWPDGRASKGMRLKSTDRYVLYQESPVEGVA